MPELPEVETITNQLNQVLSGLRIDGIKILSDKKIKLTPKQIIGLKIKKLYRRAKIIIAEFNNSDLNLLIHLKMTGQLVYLHRQSRLAGGHPTRDWLAKLPVKATKAIFSFDNKAKLYFNDQRGFGWVKQVKQSELDFHLSNFQGVEPLSSGFTWKELESICQRSSRPIKLLLHDQSKIVGLGNIYINDALWQAKIYPLTPANQLNQFQIKRLRLAIRQVLKQGLSAGGASDNTYINAFGIGGNYQNNFKVYKRQGQECLRNDGGIIERLKVGGRSLFYCPKCQKQRFLKKKAKN